MFMAPALVALGVLRLVPAIQAVNKSLHRTNLVGDTFRWVGLGNYDRLLHNDGFWQTVKVTAIFSAIVNPLQVVLALALAVLLTQKLRGTRLWRTLVFLPAAAPAAISSFIWGVAYQPGGIINGTLSRLGISQQPFLTSPSQSLGSMIILLSWIGVGYWMIFLIAGLQDIPRSYYDAAAVDGAGWWRTFTSITLPLLRRPLAFVLVADTVANFLVFAPVQILTNGGPEGSTSLVMFDIYERAYLSGDLSTAEAEVVMLMVLMVVIVSVQFRLLRTKD